MHTLFASFNAHPCREFQYTLWTLDRDSMHTLSEKIQQKQAPTLRKIMNAHRLHQIYMHFFGPKCD